jgi:hypothetical protein
MSPAVLYCDELDKALSGVATSGSTDSGVSARLFGSLLTWLNDHTSDSSLWGPAMTSANCRRSSRGRSVFFLDLPGSAEKERIWPIHLKRYDLDEGSKRPEDRDWTGAEMLPAGGALRLAAEGSQERGAGGVRAAESVEKLRVWAAGRCLDASRGGIYVRGAVEQQQPKVGRRVSRPSTN